MRVRSRRVTVKKGRLLANSNAPLTRRNLLCGGAGLVVASAIPGSASAAGDDAGPVMTKLSSYMSGAGERALPTAVSEQTKSHILDTLAAMISGSELPP